MFSVYSQQDASDADRDTIDACTCENATDGGLLPTETDFTTLA
jgi:hypothetical protein